MLIRGCCLLGGGPGGGAIECQGKPGGGAFTGRAAATCPISGGATSPRSASCAGWCCCGGCCWGCCRCGCYCCRCGCWLLPLRLPLLLVRGQEPPEAFGAEYQHQASRLRPESLSYCHPPPPPAHPPTHPPARHPGSPRTTAIKALTWPFHETVFQANVLKSRDIAMISSRAAARSTIRMGWQGWGMETNCSARDLQSLCPLRRERAPKQALQTNDGNTGNSTAHSRPRPFKMTTGQHSRVSDF